MGNDNLKLSNLPPETLKKMLEIEQRKPAYQQVQLLSDIAMMVQELISVADETKADSAEQMKALGAVLTDAREQLVSLNSKETPESPDFAKPVVEAITRLEKCMDKMDMKPVVNVPKADAPVVNVDAPKVDVKVDTKEIARMLKEDIPNAFREAIAMIPATEIPEAPDRWQEVIDWLQSIDTASRMKPQFPNIISSRITDGTDTADVVQLGTQLTTSEKGLVTNAMIHGLSSAGGGTIVDVKVNPSGALVTDSSGSSIDIKDGNTILFAKIDAASSGDNQIVAADTTRKIKVLSATLVASGTVSVKWRSGTTDLSGAMPLVANSGFVLPASAPGQGNYLETAVNTALNINLSGAVQVSGHISYYLEA